MHDLIYKSTIGTGGFIATTELGYGNPLGIAVGLATLIYMTASAIKVIKINHWDRWLYSYH